MERREKEKQSGKARRGRGNREIERKGQGKKENRENKSDALRTRESKAKLTPQRGTLLH